MYKQLARFSAVVILALIFAALGGPRAARATDTIPCYVDWNAGGTTHDGSSWTNAYLQLNLALANFSCTEIWVAEGVYTPDPSSRSNTFYIASGQVLYGGFASGDSWADRDPAAKVTILSGDIDHDDANHLTTNIDQTPTDIHGSNSYHVVWIVDVSGHVESDTRLDGFTITGGDSNGSGGGVYCSGDNSGHWCNPTLANLVFSGNRASNSGGALYNNGKNGGTSSPLLLDVLFTGNTAAFGGAMLNDGVSGGSTPTLRRVTFSDNHASYGGAMYNGGEGGWSNPYLGNVTFTGNSATYNGGAVFNEGNAGGHSSPHLSNVTFSGNSAVGNGGAMYGTGESGESLPALVNVIMWGDTAADGPEIYNDNATPDISYSDIQGSGGSTAWTGPGNDSGNNIDANPQLSLLYYSGGSEPTMPLQRGSPAVDAGYDIACGLVDVGNIDERGITRPLDGDGDGIAVCDMGATESLYVASTFKSVAAQDGWVLESGENTNVGGSKNSADANLRIGDDAANKQYRAILSFNTEAVPNTAEILSAKLRLRRSGLVGTNPFSTLGKIVVDMKQGAFGGGAALANNDFSAAPSLGNAANILSSPASGWTSKALSGAALGYINMAGVTQYRLRFQMDDNNDLTADYLLFYSGNAAASNRPQLVLTYYVP